MSIIRIAGSALLVLLCGLFPFYLRLVDYLFFHPATEQLDALHPLLPLAVLLTLSKSMQFLLQNLHLVLEGKYNRIRARITYA